MKRLFPLLRFKKRFGSCCFLIALFPLFLSAQNEKGLRGYSIFFEGQRWEQPGLNLALKLNGLPDVPAYTFGGGAGWFWQMKRFDVSLDGQFSTARKEDNANRLRQVLSLVTLGFSYQILFKGGSVYPLIGAGLAGGNTTVTQRNGATDLNTAFRTRNTTSLFNRQGFAVAGAGTRLYPKNNRGFFTVEAGYRPGFGATLWSTDEQATAYMANSVTDELRQVYLKLGLGLYMRKR